MTNSDIHILLRILFWDPIRPGENWAQTLVRVAGNLTRTAITLGLVFLAVALLLQEP